MPEYDEDELDEFLAEDRPFLSRNAIRTGMFIACTICVGIGIGYLAGPGFGWLFIGALLMAALVMGGNN